MSFVLDRIRSAVLFLAIAAPLQASTWIVDVNGGPGVHFTDLPPAIAAAAPGDVILVRGGTYAAFTLSKGLTIIGTPGNPPTCTSIVSTVYGFNSTVSAPAGETAILADLRFADSVSVSNCSGVVIADGVRVVKQLAIGNSVDVRLHRFTGDVNAASSTLEVASSTLQGMHGSVSPGNGDNGLTLTGSNALVALTSCKGGWGRDEPIGGFNGTAGSGGDGIRIRPSAGALSTLVLAGGGANVVQGGGGGYGQVWGDGYDGNGLVNDRSGVWRSGCTYTGGSNTNGGQALVYLPGAGSFDTAIAPNDPALALVGTATAGGSVQLDTRATPGSVVRIVIGRQPTQIQTPPVRVQKLVSTDSVIFVGVVPAGGVISYAVPLRLGYSPGTTFYAQAYVADTSAAESRRTNSVPIVVR